MRTTIPMVYNMDSYVKQLDVIDFPGVDDSDERIRQLCRVMFDLVQISVYVVDYRFVNTCTYAHTHACTHASTHAHMHTCTYTDTYMYMHTVSHSVIIFM